MDGPRSPGTASRPPRGRGLGLRRPGARARTSRKHCDNRGMSSFQRTNGRAADALRPVTITRHYTRHA